MYRRFKYLAWHCSYSLLRPSCNLLCTDLTFFRKIWVLKNIWCSGAADCFCFLSAMLQFYFFISINFRHWVYLQLFTLLLLVLECLTICITWQVMNGLTLLYYAKSLHLEAFLWSARGTQRCLVVKSWESQARQKNQWVFHWTFRLFLTYVFCVGLIW